MTKCLTATLWASPMLAYIAAPLAACAPPVPNAYMLSLRHWTPTGRRCAHDATVVRFLTVSTLFSQVSSARLRDGRRGIRASSISTW